MYWINNEVFCFLFVYQKSDSTKENTLNTYYIKKILPFSNSNIYEKWEYYLPNLTNH